MQKIWNKGHRIRASDKHLVYHFSIGTLLFVFVAVLLLLNIKQLMLSCGRATARKIGEQAGAKIVIGRRVLYSIEKVKKYLLYLEE
ncbi:MAG: hypothetical protein ACLUUG_09805 [Lachnospiraceae bacterium]